MNENGLQDQQPDGAVGNLGVAKKSNQLRENRRVEFGITEKGIRPRPRADESVRNRV